ncbi:hypothetical protein [Arenimonas fontis]|uniref:Lipoprotein n=1 Tax=Arenimonas fontis TaxID=2608255 RepID=A0A5B2ZF29_9GAMM|nr:hypothetical protein [Arenimonas fontis]KAA2285814.1 hypothetical protein F0415_04140 [Arenimonas fontis]
MRSIFALSLALALTACAAPAPPDPAVDEQAGAALLARYEQARADGNPELAERLGNELDDRHGKTAAAATMRESIGEVRRQAEALRGKRRLAGLWDYQSVPVPGGTQHTAAIYSRVPAWSEDSGLPPPRPDARLILRRHPQWGDSAYLVLQMRELRCGPPCELSVRFDEGEAQRFAGEPADTGTGPALFIEDRERFLDALDAAAEVHIQLPQSGALRPSFSFEVGGFDRARHEAGAVAD